MIILIIGIIIAVVGVVLGCIEFADGEPGKGALAMVVCTILGICIALTSMFASIPTGYTGIVTTFGKVEDYTLDAGIHAKAPWKRVVEMDNRVQKQTVELSCFSSDIQEVSVKYTLNYQIDKAEAMNIYKTIGVNYYETAVAPNIAEAVKVITAKFSAEDLVGNRNELAVSIEEELTNKLADYNIQVISTSIEDMDFTDAFTNAVEAKQVAQQNKLKAQTEAEQQVIEAEASAKIKKVQAEAEAYEIVTKAEAEAEANRKLAESLTPSLIQYAYAQNWNGELPEYLAGNDNQAIPMFNFGK